MDLMKNLGFSKRDAENKTMESKPQFTDRYPRKEGETRIYNLIILDESGSMGDIRAEALAGANETILSIKKAQKDNPDDNQMLGFVTFDSWDESPYTRTIIDCEKIENVGTIAERMYSPRGMTPLYDAMGISINSLKGLVQKGDHVLVTVITDGFENSSREYSAEMIKKLVEDLSKEGWVFTYIGANQDSEKAAGGLGIRSAMDFKATVTGSAVMWDRMNSSRQEYYKKVRYSKMTGSNVDFEDDFFAKKQALTRVTPNNIDVLKPGQIFVFGSNEAGLHLGGAARTALECFGAVYGQGVGLQGNSYAIPTMNLSLPIIKGYVQDFIQFADMHPELTFLVTRVGCGIAGYRDEDIAPLFARAYNLPNVYLPAEFWKVLSFKY